MSTGPRRRIVPPPTPAARLPKRSRPCRDGGRPWAGSSADPDIAAAGGALGSSRRRRYNGLGGPGARRPARSGRPGRCGGDMDRLSVLCFAGTYGLALASDLARFVVRHGAQWYLTILLTALGWAVQTAYLANLAVQS